MSKVFSSDNPNSVVQQSETSHRGGLWKSPHKVGPKSVNSSISGRHKSMLVTIMKRKVHISSSPVLPTISASFLMLSHMLW